MRDYLVAAVIFGLIPVCFFRPWIGVLVWTWLGLMNPHRLTWGFASHMPFAQYVAIATLAGLPFTREIKWLPASREVYLLMGFWCVCLLSTLFAAFYPEVAWQQFIKVSKIFLMFFVTLMLIYDRKRLKILVWVVAMSIGFYGLKGGIWAIATGGQYRVRGPERSFIEGNTEIGLALLMILPLLLLLAREEHIVWLKKFLYMMFGFAVVAVLVTYSRGAFLGLCAVLAALFLKSRAKIVTLALIIVAVPLAVSFLPEKWFGRMETIETYEQDRSAMGRVMAWKVAVNIALDHPLLGAGFRPFTRETFIQYLPEYDSYHEAHSIFFQVLAEHGFVGLSLFVALLASTFLSLRQIMWTAKRDPTKTWMVSYAQLIEAGLIGYVISGLFLSLSYFDLYYTFVALTVILKRLCYEKKPVRWPRPVKKPIYHELGSPSLQPVS